MSLAIIFLWFINSLELCNYFILIVKVNNRYTSQSLYGVWSRYSWTSREIEDAENASLLLAADVIYSDDLTDAFFSTLERLMSRGSTKVYAMWVLNAV